MSAIRLEGVSKSYGAVPAVVDCSLEVADGELLALLGPSGCGKTTVLRLLGGFLWPDRGAIRIGDRDVAGLPPFRRNIGFTFQSYALFPHLTVWDNVAFGLRDAPPLPRRAGGRPRAACGATWTWSGSKGATRATPTSSRAGSSSGWRSPGRWPSSPRCSCWTSRSASLDKKLRDEMQAELKAPPAQARA